jgi:hypothetical protein
MRHFGDEHGRLSTFGAIQATTIAAATPEFRVRVLTTFLESACSFSLLPAVDERAAAVCMLHPKSDGVMAFPSDRAVHHIAEPTTAILCRLPAGLSVR